MTKEQNAKPVTRRRAGPALAKNIHGVEVLRVDVDKFTQPGSFSWWVYCLQLASRTVSLLGQLPVVQFEGQQLVLYAVNPAEVT